MDATPNFLSTLLVTPADRRSASTVLLASVLIFVALAPFAKTPLAPVWAFIPMYQSWLIGNDAITAVLLYSQFNSFRSPAGYLLAGGYAFTALMALVHMLSFPGLFAPTGLLGAGPQTTAWLYMIWHGGFPLCVAAYALLDGRGGRPELSRAEAHQLLRLSLLGAVLVASASLLLTTRGQALLPPIMNGNRYTPAMIVVVSSVWGLSLGALVLMWRRRHRSVLDLWLTVVLCAWLIDIALSAVLNGGRFDLGFYAGRLYGLLAASFVLVVLLAESGALYARLIELTQVLQRLTAQDALTGIANRRSFDAALDMEWRRAARSGLPLSLLMIDVDHFKRYNDGHGHVAGDQCLRAVAAALGRGTQRASDLVARYGGEEFAVLLPETDEKEALHMAERLGAAVRRLEIPHGDSTAGPNVTISIGVATMRPAAGAASAAKPDAAPGSPATALIEHADQALYCAKSQGRDRFATQPA